MSTEDFWTKHQSVSSAIQMSDGTHTSFHAPFTFWFFFLHGVDGSGTDSETNCQRTSRQAIPNIFQIVVILTVTETM